MNNVANYVNINNGTATVNPVSIRTSFFASDKSLMYGSFRHSTIAPDLFFKSTYFGRNMLQITTDFQATLGPLQTGIIPKGTLIQIGIPGKQLGMPGGLPYLQITTPKGIPFKSN